MNCTADLMRVKGICIPFVISHGLKCHRFKDRQLLGLYNCFHEVLIILYVHAWQDIETISNLVNLVLLCNFTTLSCILCISFLLHFFVNRCFVQIIVKF